MSLDVAMTTGGPTLPQERRLVTAIPGPRSIELQARRTAAVSAGVGGTLPVYIVAAGGGVLVDVDGNSLIDMGSGIAVTTVGNSAPKVVENVQRQVAEFTHTCFMVTPYESYVAVCEALNELTPGDHVKRSALFNSGAEAVENAVKIARAYTHRQAIVVFEHGYHGRTNLTMGMTAKNMPYKHSFGPFAPEIYRVPAELPVPRRADRGRGRSPRRSAGSTRRSARTTSPRSSSSRSPVRAGSSSRPRASCPSWSSSHAPTGSCSWPTRSRPASAAPATGSPATTRASSPT